jgi:predicted nuclease with TOPRIM domain
MTPTLEDLARFYAGKPTPTDILRNQDLIAAAFTDLSDRLANLEHNDLQAQHRLGLIETKQAQLETVMAGFATDREEFRTRVDNVEKIPTASKERIDDLETRVRAVEGAVGSKNFTATKPDVALPSPAAGGPATPSPVLPPAPKPGFFGGTAAPAPSPA